MNAAPHPIAWAVFADNGNMRLWSTDRAEVLAFADKVGAPLIALHPGPPIQSAHTDDAVGNACRLLRDAAQELAEGISVNGVPDWKNEPETHGAYVEHITAAHRLEQWAVSIGAGGVEPLRRRECLHQIAEPAQAAPAAVAVPKSFDADGFKAWVKRNLPDDTIIGSSEWWANHLTLWAQRFFTVSAAPKPQVAVQEPIEVHEPKCPALIGDACTCDRHDPAVDKAWARFCAKIGDGPNAPYPGMISAFERYYSQSFADKDWRVEASVWAAAWKAALLHHPAPQPAPEAQGDAEQRAMDAAHAQIYRWIIANASDALYIIDNWCMDDEADTDDLHDSLAAARAQAKKGGAA